MKISVLTPSFRSGKSIERAILSVINQNYTDFEHIIIDGGSMDETLGILQKYSHLKWISEPDKGQSDAMNKAFALSTGDIIVYLNADDYFEPGTFEEVETIFLSFPTTDIAVGNIYTIEEGLKKPTRLFNSEYRFNRIILPYKYGFPYNPLGYFYKRYIQEKCGLFPVNEHLVMDYWFVLRAFHNSRIFKSGKVFGTYVGSENNKSSLHKCNLNKIVFQFMKSCSLKTKSVYWVRFTSYVIEYKVIREIKEGLKYILYLLIRMEYTTYFNFKEKGFKNLVKK